MEFCASNGRLQPGFRFHPTNEELVMYYLKRKVLGKCLTPEIVTEVDVYQFHPKDLRDLACLKKDLNWYFFCHRGKKYLCGERTNRATHSGFWKATGNDRVVSYDDRTVGKIKTLVFHEGKPPKGTRTDWVMHEYRLEDQQLADKGVFQGSYVLCKIFKKSGWGPKNAEQYGAPFVEEEWNDDDDEIRPQMGDQNPSDSVVINPSLPVNAYASSSLGQFYPGTVSVSAMDQVPSPVPNAAANIASSSEGVIPGFDYVVDQVVSLFSSPGNLVSYSTGPCSNYNGHPTLEASTPMPYAVGISSTSTCPFSNYNDHPTAEASTPMPNAVGIASTSTAPFSNYNDHPIVEASTPMPNAVGIASTSNGLLSKDEDDDIPRMMDMIVAAEESWEIFEGLADLDRPPDWPIESSAWGNIDESGLYLDDLDPPL